MEDQGLGSSGDLGGAVESISEVAPKLSGLDKLNAQRAASEKTTTRAGEGGGHEPPVPIKPSAPTQPAPKPGEQPLPGAAAYAPDFKYKAQGKEFEIPEKFKALITDKASEEELKTLFGKSQTVEEYKSSIDTLKKDLGERSTALNSYQSGVQQLRQIAAKGDWDTWFQKLNIPPEKIYQWVLDKVNYNQLPAEQRSQMDAQRDLKRQAEMAQEQVGQASAREMHLATQMKSLQLEQTLGKADVKSMGDAFDSRAGKPGAFRDAIIEHGKAVWALSNFTVDLTPEQAIADFVQKYGNPSAFANQPGAAGAVHQSDATTTSSANAQPPVKVIPNVAGRSTSPVKQKPKNMDDLKRLRDQAIKEDNAQRGSSQGYLAG